MNLEDRQKIMELIMDIIYLSNKVHRLGILSLDDDAPSLRPEFLRKAILFMIEGFNAEELRSLLDFDLHQTEDSERELLEKQIIKEGILYILNGDDGKILFEKIILILGDHFFEYMD